MEIWKDVKGYEDYFMISNHGKIFSKRSNKLLKLQNNKEGYLCFCTKIGGRNGKYFYFRVHRLVAENFIPNHENHPVVNHVDGNKHNNYYKNLEWTTVAGNNQHAYDTGLNKAKSGEDNHYSKLSNAQVREIRKRKNNGETCVALGKEYGVHHTQISRICRNVTYKK